MKPMFFTKPAHFRQWLHENHNHATEVWVGYYKKSTKIECIDWPASVQEAVCYGWIDGIRKTIDDKSYKIRFTPRKPDSIWSALNIKYVAALTKEGKMMPAGIKAFKKRKDDKSSIYSHEQNEVKLNKRYEDQIKANKKAWIYFESLPPGYKKHTIYYVMSAKREATQLKRMQILIESAEQGLKIPHLRRK
ncbi:MAG: YdeI/OmpD-associated family protein [Chitinophagales bacterium]